jgi:hypothetical protein
VDFGTLEEVPYLPNELKMLRMQIPIILSLKYYIGKNGFYTGLGITNNIILSKNKNFKVVIFEEQYGRTFNTYTPGLILKAAYKREILQDKFIGMNILYEVMGDARGLNKFLRLQQNRFSFQLSYGF